MKIRRYPLCGGDAPATPPACVKRSRVYEVFAIAEVYAPRVR